MRAGAFGRKDIEIPACVTICDTFIIGRSTVSEHVTIRLSTELRDSLKAHAKATHKSQSAVMVEAFVEYLKGHDRAIFQREADRECQILNEADGQDPGLDEFMDAAVEDMVANDDENREWM